MCCGKPVDCASIFIVCVYVLLCQSIICQAVKTENSAGYKCDNQHTSSYFDKIHKDMQKSVPVRSSAEVRSSVADDKDLCALGTSKTQYTDKDFKSDSSEEENDDHKGASKGQQPRGKKYKQTTLDFERESAGSSKKKKKDKYASPKKWLLKKRLSDKDTKEYRDGYPNKKDDPNLKDNLRFYEGEIPSTPDGAYIDEIHEDWFGNYRLLEQHHGYIQWIFPIRENGMNWQAQALQLHEAKAICENKVLSKRVVKSYKLMLDFYGMKLADFKTGSIERSDNWEERYDNLNRSQHNYLRITRILKSLGELGLEHLKKPFLQFVLMEVLEEENLKRTLSSCRDYWIGTVKDDEDREELYRYIENRS